MAMMIEGSPKSSSENPAYSNRRTPPGIAKSTTTDPIDTTIQGIPRAHVPTTVSRVGRWLRSRLINQPKAQTCSSGLTVEYMVRGIPHALQKCACDAMIPRQLGQCAMPSTG